MRGSRLIGIGDMPAQHPKEIMMEGSKKQYVDETRQFSPAGLIIRQKEPTNLEMPFDQVDSYLTPAELFYIRSHFPAPKLDAAGYRLRIDGAVRNPLVDELQGIAGDAVRDADRHFGVRG